MDSWAWEQLETWQQLRIGFPVGAHANLGVTSIYLQGIDNSEIIDTVHARRAPVIPATAGLSLPLDSGSPPQKHGLAPSRRGQRPRTSAPTHPVAAVPPPRMPTHSYG